jgi:uncharacterized membrane protein
MGVDTFMHALAALAQQAHAARPTPRHARCGERQFRLRRRCRILPTLHPDARGERADARGRFTLTNPDSFMGKLVLFGRLCFAIAIVAFGVEHLVYADFVTRVVPFWPAWIPAHASWAYGVGVALVIAGAAIIFRIQARAIAMLLGAAILLSVVSLYLPMVLANLTNGGLITNTFKAIALSGGAFAVARTFARLDGDDGLLWIGRLFFGSFLIVAGVLHFVYPEFVATLVPRWIPGDVFWTYFAAVALIAGGLGIMIPPVARLAALCSGVMIFTWFLILHIPRSVAAPHSVNELTAVFEALAMSGIAFVLAGSARETLH